MRLPDLNRRPSKPSKTTIICVKAEIMLLWLQFCSFQPLQRNKPKLLPNASHSIDFLDNKAELKDSQNCVLYESGDLFANLCKRLLFHRFELLFLAILDRCNRETGAIVRHVLE